MSYASIAVHVAPTPESHTRVALAAALAERFGSHLIGLAVDDPQMSVFAASSPTIAAQADGEAADLLRVAEQQFYAFSGRAPSREWRGGVDLVLDALLDCANAAELFVAGLHEEDPPEHRMSVDAGILTAKAGRPVLVAPKGVETLPQECALIAWKSARECRRAVTAALPLLKLCKRVRLVCIDGDPAEDRAMTDAVQLLLRHGVEASSGLRTSSRLGTVATLLEVALESGADLIVSGAYGHSKFEEWVLGGFTYDLLAQTDRLTLICN